MRNDECPACMTILLPSAVSCPICMRRRTRKEMMAALQAPKRQARSRRRLLLFVAALASASAGYYAWRNQVQASARVSARTTATAPGAAPSAAPPEQHATFFPASAAPAGTLIPAQPAPQAPPAVPRQAAEQAPDADGQIPAEPPGPAVWTASGEVYDLFSLKPVAGAKITFTDSSGKRFKATTSAAGLYKARLPRPAQGGYAVSVRRTGYRDDYLEEGDPPYRKQDEGRREDAAYQASESRVLHLPATAGPDGSLREDIILIPRD